MRGWRIVLAGACWLGFGMVASPALGQKESPKGAAPGQEWNEVTAAHQRFRASFPGTPKQTLSSRVGNNIRFETSQHAFDRDGGRVRFVVYCELLADQNKEEAKRFLDSVSTSMAGFQTVAMKSTKEIQLGDQPGIELEYQRTLSQVPSDVLFRAFKVGRIYYQIYAYAPAGTLDIQEARKFLDSFQVLGADQDKKDATGGAKILLQDSFQSFNGVALTRHWMDRGPGWQAYGKGAWQIHNKRAKIVRLSEQDIVAADAGEATATLTCDLVTPADQTKGMDAGVAVRMVDNDNLLARRLLRQPPGSLQEGGRRLQKLCLDPPRLPAAKLLPHQGHGRRG